MDAVKIPTSLDWEKQKGALAKVKAAQPVKDSLDKVQRAHESTDWSAFGADKLGTPAEAEKRLADLEREAKVSLKLLADKAAEAEKAAKKACEEAKKDKSREAAEAAKALDAMGKAAAQLQKDVADFIDSARRELQAQLDRLSKAAAKDKKPAPAGKPALTKEAKFIRAKAIECLRKIKAPVPGARPWRFLIGKGPKSTGIVLLQTPPGAAHFNMLKKMLPGEKLQMIRDPKGEVVWENKSVTLVTMQPVSGVGKKLNLWFKPLVGLNVKFRVRKPTGEVMDDDKDVQGDDLPDDLLKPDPAEAAERAAAGKEFTKRLAALAGAIKQALANPALPAESKAEIKALVDSIGSNGKAQKFEDANDDLDSLEALLEEEPPEAAAAPGGLSVKQLAEARLTWKNDRENAIKEIKRLAERITREFAAEKEQLPQVKKAVTDLYALADKSLKADLENHLDAALNASDAAKRAQAVATAKRTLKEIRSLLDTNPVLKEIDGNEVIPDMSVVAPMKQSLSAVEAALG